MKIYMDDELICIQRTKRMDYMLRKLRRWRRNTLAMADLVLTLIIVGAAVSALVLGCMVDSMELLTFLKAIYACAIIGTVSWCLRCTLRGGRRQ